MASTGLWFYHYRVMSWQFLRQLFGQTSQPATSHPPPGRVSSPDYVGLTVVCMVTRTRPVMICQHCCVPLCVDVHRVVGHFVENHNLDPQARPRLGYHLTSIRATKLSELTPRQDYSLTDLDIHPGYKCKRCTSRPTCED